MRARQPDRAGSVTRDGVTVAYDIYGEGNSPTVVLMPAWSIANVEHWKFQIPVLSRRFRVIAIDGRGNGRSDRPRDAVAYLDEEYVADAVAILDATGTDHAVICGVSMGGPRAARLAATHPDRAVGVALISP